LRAECYGHGLRQYRYARDELPACRRNSTHTRTRIAREARCGAIGFLGCAVFGPRTRRHGVGARDEAARRQEALMWPSSEDDSDVGTRGNADSAKRLKYGFESRWGRQQKN
jgi:hypothetical protein